MERTTGSRALKFTQGALRAIAREALECKSGARSLHAII
jgi:ATP-dependent protease Clp ATPase subunit